MKRIRSEKEGDALDPGPPLNWFPCGPFLYNPPVYLGMHEKKNLTFLRIKKW